MHQRPERLSRSMLFTPGSRPELAAKAARSAADAVCLDLEDAVAPGEKERSRALVAGALASTNFGGRTRIVRVNGLDTRWTYRDIIEVVEAAGQHLDVIMLPKAESAADVMLVDRLLTQIEATHGIPHRIGIEVQIETAAGFLNAREIAAASPRLEALIFGMGDYAASLRMPLANVGTEDEYDAAFPGLRWHPVMHAVVAAARANGLRCMDGPFGNYRDDAGLARSARMARALGFDGKQCIHPGQLEAVNAAFTPSDEEVERARRMVETWERGAAEGLGAVGSDGIMIDAVNMRMARTTTRAAELIAARTRGGSA